MAIDWYNEFVDTNYEPAKDDIVCLFYFEPAAGITDKEAAGRIASESSTGTWTTLATLPPRMKKLEAKAFDFDGHFVKVAYPLALWEEGNAVQLMSGIAGKHLRHEGTQEPAPCRCVTSPQHTSKASRVPHFGMEGNPEDDGDPGPAADRCGAQAEDRVLRKGALRRSGTRPGWAALISSRTTRT